MKRQMASWHFASILDIRPDIILTDIKMPFMDGLTFAKEAKKLLPLVRIIFISGFDDFDYAKTALQLQADDYLLKPIKNEDLEQTLIKVICCIGPTVPRTTLSLTR